MVETAPASTRKRSEYRFYRWTQWGFIIFVIAYQLIVLERERVMGQGELFPFASWSLFTLVPDDVDDYALRILEVDDQDRTLPLWFEHSDGYFVAARDHAAHTVIDIMGKAYERGELDEADAIRRKFERLYFNEAKQVRYELVARTYDPLERWHTGKLIRTQTLATYAKEAP